VVRADVREQIQVSRQFSVRQWVAHAGLDPRPINSLSSAKALRCPMPRTERKWA
jgi:hypothetical protein